MSINISNLGTQLPQGAQTNTSTYPNCTVTAGASFLVFSIAWNQSTISASGVSWSGNGTPQNLTFIGAITGTNTRLEFWGLVNPIAEVNGTFTTAFSGSGRLCVEFTTWTGTVEDVFAMLARTKVAPRTNDEGVGLLSKFQLMSGVAGLI